MPRRLLVCALLVGVLQPGPLWAQDGQLSDILVRLIQAEVRLAGPPPGSPFPSHEAHFLPGEGQQLTPFLFNQGIVSQLSTAPIGASPGGFSYAFDPGLGTYARSTTSFGPSLAERAVTLGKGRLNTGLNYQHSTYRSYEGKRLDAGEIQFFLTHQPGGMNAFFEGDVVRAALSMDLSTDTVAFFGTYGLTDRLDIGVVVPVTRVELDASVNATILRLATLDTGPTSTIHTFPGGGSSATLTDGGSAAGIGDVLVRGKFQVLQRRGGGLALGVDLRTPTGDADNLLGTGATQAKFLLIGSTAIRRFAPHFNIGYTASGESSNDLINITDEFNYAGGIEFTPWPQLTLAADLVGRQLRDSGRLVEQPKVFNWRTQAGVTGSATFDEFAFESGSLNLALAAIGFKFNPVANLLVSANVLFPLTDAGIRSRPVPVLGLDYTF